jgi:hypothetical protein
MDAVAAMDAYPSHMLSFDQSALYDDMPQNKLISELMLSHWSRQFAEFLDESPSAIKMVLLQLQNIYQARNLKLGVELIDRLSLFPGNPFLNSHSFRRHMSYVRRYFDELSGKQLPRIPFIAIPKSASSYVSVVLCRLLDVNPTVISYRHLIGIRAWVNAFKRFGGVMHDHYYPLPANLKIFHDAGINEVIIHNRHPMDALISKAYHWVKEVEATKKLTGDDKRVLVNEFCQREMEARFDFQAKWLRGWRAESEAGRITLHLTSFEEMKADKLAFFTRLLSIMNVPYSPWYLRYIIENIESKKNKTNFNIRHAETRDWNQILEPGLVKRATNLLADEYADLVD